MPAIAKHNDVLTVIIILAVESSRQQQLVDTIIEFLEVVKQQQVLYPPVFIKALMAYGL